MPTSVAMIRESAFDNCRNIGDVYYSGSQDQWERMDVTALGNEPLVNATIHFHNGTTVNGPEKDADFKIGTISAYDQAAGTIRIAGQIFAAADSFDFGGLDQIVSAKERMIATFQNGKITKIERVKDVLRVSASVTENSKPPITLQSSGYMQDRQDVLVRLTVVSDYPDSAFRGVDDIGLDVGEMTVSVGTESIENIGFCISRSQTERDETAKTVKEPINRKLSYGETANYEYVVYACKEFTFTSEELPYVVSVNADTENGAAIGQKILYAYFEYTQQEVNLTNTRQELENLKNGDPLSLEQDLQNYLSEGQLDVIESYLFTWMAELDYAYRYQGDSGVKERIQRKVGLSPEADFASGNETAVTHMIVDTKFGKKTIEVTLDIGRPDGQGHLYPAYGAMRYEILEKSELPQDLQVKGQIGKASYTDMGQFAACVAKANEDSLHNTYQWESLQEELTAGVLIDKTVIGIIVLSEGKRGGWVSDLLFHKQEFYIRENKGSQSSGKDDYGPESR